MMGMFFSASSFNQNLSKWDVSNVSYMGSMFSEATAFNQDLSSWNLSGATDMYGMFKGASSFNQNLCPWRETLNPYVIRDEMLVGSGCPIETTSSVSFCHRCSLGGT